MHAEAVTRNGDAAAVESAVSDAEARARGEATVVDWADGGTGRGEPVLRQLLVPPRAVEGRWVRRAGGPVGGGGRAGRRDGGAGEEAGARGEAVGLHAGIEERLVVSVGVSRIWSLKDWRGGLYEFG